MLHFRNFLINQLRAYDIACVNYEKWFLASTNNRTTDHIQVDIQLNIYYKFLKLREVSILQLYNKNVVE